MTRSQEPKPGLAQKRLGPHGLVTPVAELENRVFHSVLGPGHRSLTTGGEKAQILNSYFSKRHAC